MYPQSTDTDTTPATAPHLQCKSLRDNDLRDVRHIPLSGAFRGGEGTYPSRPRDASPCSLPRACVGRIPFGRNSSLTVTGVWRFERSLTAFHHRGHRGHRELQRRSTQGRRGHRGAQGAGRARPASARLINSKYLGGSAAIIRARSPLLHCSTVLSDQHRRCSSPQMLQLPLS